MELIKQAKEYFFENPADRLRLGAGMRANGYTGEFEDDPEKFFRRSIWDVGSGDVIRWHACCVALRELKREGV